MKVYLFICILLSIFHLESPCQGEKMVFDHLSIHDGLSQNNVLSILQDKKGYVWFGTYNGLNRYDGYTFKTFKFDARDSSSLSQHLILCLYEDREGLIWVGTAGMGLCKFDPATETFTRYPFQKDSFSLHYPTVVSINEDISGNLWIGTVEGISRFDKRAETFRRYLHNPHDTATISTNGPINTIYRDKEGTLWIGTGGGGMNVLAPGNERGEKATFTRYLHNPEERKSIPDNDITAFCEDHKGILWMGSLNGLIAYDRKAETFQLFTHKTGNPNSLSSNRINLNALAEDHEGNLWIGTENGLNKLDRERKKMTRFFHNPTDPASLSSNDVHSIMADRTGIIWIGTIGGGVNKLDPNKRHFATLRHDPFNPNSLSSNAVRAICEGSDGMLWIGTEGGGLNRFDPAKGAFTFYRYKPGNPAGLKSDFVGAITEDSDGNLWIGYGGGNYYSSFGRGITKMNKSTGEFVLTLESSREATLDADVFTIYEDKRNVLWVGTENGFWTYERKSKRTAYFPYDPDNFSGISDYWVYTILEDSNENIWIGTGSKALNKYDRKTQTFKHYRHDPADPRSISSNSVKSIYEDTKGNLWFGTSGGGLCLYDPASDGFTAYLEKHGLPDNTVYGILEDDEGNLWLSTNLGLSCFSPTAGRFINFDESDGLQSNQFSTGYVNAGASYKGKDGTLYFGGQNGLNIIRPAEITFNKNIPPVVITQFSVFDKPLPVSKLNNEIVLTYDQNFFSFEFAALNFTNSHKNRYAYQLENFDQDWIFSGTRRYAGYTNLDPGEYLFRVKAANNDGVWNEAGTAVKISILPPWWQSWWAYVLYILTGSGVLWWTFVYVISRERLRAALKLQQLEAAKMQEIDQLKSRFYTNISHEFRTPLTLILGPVEKLLYQSESNTVKPLYQLIQRNAQRLLTLVNQLLDLSKLETGLKIEARKGDIVRFLDTVFLSFNQLAEIHKISYSVKLPSTPAMANFDADKLEKIATNLLTNAFKFTPEGGSVSASAWLESMDAHSGPVQLKIEVTDTGVGIPADQLYLIFNRFYQANNTNGQSEGMGIGLALSRELTELLGGRISVSSAEGKGSTFTVFLPLHLETEASPDFSPFSRPGTPPAEVSLAEVREEEGGISSDNQEKEVPTLLVIEDNPEVRQFICQQLPTGYHLLEAGNGKEGIERAIAHIPDLIVCDIMMPDIDGMEVCRQLKSNELTCHIPVILLTARAGTDDRLAGLTHGADDYITKPFRMAELVVRIKNLIEQRKLLRKRFGKEMVLQPKGTPVTSTDEKFLRRVLAIVEEHIADESFGVEIFAREAAMSRAQLYRKLHALTGQSPGEFIKAIRMKRAACLLLQQYGNISEVAFATGYSDPSYFTKCFREEFGKSPSEYVAASAPDQLQ